MKRLLALSLLVLLPQIASAHPGHDGDHDFEWGFSAGVTHPLTGVDHLLAMVAVGLWAAQLGGRARYAVPAAFVGAMAIGAALTRFGVALPIIEPLVAASVVALGLLIAIKIRVPAAVGAIIAAGFALFHGAAHASEFQSTTNGMGAYAAGFLLATAGLHLAGFGFGHALEKRQHREATGLIGAAVALSGAVMLLS